jgi:hypothetical protein
VVSEMQDRLGPVAVIENLGEPLPEDSRDQFGSPYVAGLGIAFQGSSNNDCSTAFGVAWGSGKNVNYGILTASHCVHNGWSVRHGNNTGTAGTVVCDQNGGQDAALVDVQDNNLVNHLNYYANNGTSAIYDVGNPGALANGVIHCLSGKQADSIRCGDYREWVETWEAGGHVNSSGHCARYARQGGDSGGAVLTWGLSTPYFVAAQGVHSDVGVCGDGQSSGIFSYIGGVLTMGRANFQGDLRVLEG